MVNGSGGLSFLGADLHGDDEILVREARRRGYDDSSRIRTLLIQNMRFFIKQDLPAPGVEVLRAYFETNIERFTRPPSLDMEQVYFEDAGSIPGNLLEELKPLKLAA